MATLLGGMNSQEHRETPRIHQAFLVRYRGLSDYQRSWLVAPLQDLSDRGARFLSERAFIMGDELEIRLTLPAASMPIALNAKVAWTKLARLGLIELGVTFETSNPDTQEAIHAAVEHFLRQKEKA
jgi:Tfp pilus assembly protein PilZ